MADYTVRDFAAQEALYGEVNEVSGLSGDQLPASGLCRVRRGLLGRRAGNHLPAGPDANPRGDAPGFIEIVDDRTLLTADRRDNKRIDGLPGIVADPPLALLLMIPA